ncbi:MAG TPA: YcgL domain-containing protein [Gammaproteobacteria bacterium]
MSTTCTIYKSLSKDGLYIYLRDREMLATLPEALLKSLGNTELVMELELTPERTLARADVKEVIKSLDEKGFYVQMPPRDPALL